MNLQWLDGTGRLQPLLPQPGDYNDPRLSPDGNRLALVSKDDIFVYEWRRDVMRRLTFDGGHRSPAWTPDGRYLIFYGAGGLFWARGANSTNGNCE